MVAGNSEFTLKSHGSFVAGVQTVGNWSEEIKGMRGIQQDGFMMRARRGGKCSGVEGTEVGEEYNLPGLLLR